MNKMPTKFGTGLMALGQGLQGGNPMPIVQNYRENLEREERKGKVANLQERLSINPTQRGILDALPVEAQLQWLVGYEGDQRKRAAAQATAAREAAAERGQYEAFQAHLQPTPGPQGPHTEAASQGPVMDKARLMRILSDQRVSDDYKKRATQMFELDNAPEGESLGFSDERALSKEFHAIAGVKDFDKQATAFGRIQASATDPSPAGDLALIFNYMKVLDPGSVVRESEFATAENTGSVPDRIWKTYNKILQGERLAPTQRADFVDRANRLYQSAETQFIERFYNPYIETAKGYNFDPARIITDYRYRLRR
jgi:hypothetical protein